MATFPSSSTRLPTLAGDDVIQAYQLNSALRRQQQPTTREQWAKALLQQNSSGAPVRSPLEGLARMLTAGIGGYVAGQERLAGQEGETQMLADMLGRKSQQAAEEQRQLAGLGVPGFTMPPAMVEPGVARPQPTAMGGEVTIPPGAEMPATPAPAPVDAALIQAVSALGAGGNRTAQGALSGLQFQYQDRRTQEREDRAEKLAQAREARAAAAAERETWGNPVEVRGPDGNPMFVRFGSRGGMHPVENAFPPPPEARPQPPTEIERTLAAAGIEPGTPEFQRLMRQYAEGKIAPPPNETFDKPTVMRGPDGTPQLVQVGNRGTIRPVQGYSAPEEGPPKAYDGKSVEGQSLNILLAPNADPASPVYAAAFNRLYGPRTVTQTDGTIVTIQPAVPQGVRHPSGAGGSTSPASTAAPSPGIPTPGGGAVTQVPGGKERPLTEAQSKANMFGNAMTEGDRIIGSVGSPSTAAILAWRNLPESGVNLSLPEKDQKYFNALRQFAAGVLRKETGAAFTPNELLDVQSRFFPMPGDTQAVKEQKARARRQAIESMRAEIPGGFRGQLPSDDGTPQPPGAVPPPPPGFEVRR